MPARESASPVIAPITQRRFTTSDGVGLNLLEAGRVAGSPVVCFVPGWIMPAWLWRDQLAALADRFQVVAMDPRGQGESDVPASGLHIDRRADDIAEVVANFSGSTPGVVLVGWSLGALESLQYVARHGESAIAGLVLVDSSVGQNPAPADSSAFRTALVRDRRATTREFVENLCRKPRPPAEIDALAEAVLRLPLQESLGLLPSHLPREHWRDIVESVAAPVLYAVTSQFAGQAKNLVERRPGTQVECFEAAGHALFLDEPHRFSAMLTAFVEGLKLLRRDAKQRS